MSGMLLGMNLAAPTNLEGALAFSNLMYQSTGWELESETNVGTTVWTQRRGVLTVTAVTGTAVFRRVLYNNAWIAQADYMPNGQYTLKNANGYSLAIGAYTGTGLLGFSATTTDRPFSFSGASGVMALHMQVTATGSYGNGIKVLIPNHDGTDPFNAQFIAYLQGLGSSGGPLRFMDWQSTNTSPDTDWADRALPTDPALDPGAGVPWELCFQLCNRVNRDPWVNIPTRATDAYVTSFGNLALASLNAGRNVWLERSNEMWNTFNVFYGGTQWMTYNNHPRYTATVNATTGVISTPVPHTLANGETVLPFATRTTISNGISKDSANTAGNYYFAHLGVPCTVSDVTTNTYRVKDSGGNYITFPAVRGDAAYATNSVTDLVYVRVSDAGATNVDTNYAARAVADWAILDGIMGSSRVKAIMGTQVANTGVGSRTRKRLAVSGASRFNYVAGAPYYKGDWFIGAVDVASGQFTPKVWTTDPGTTNIHYGVYAQGSTPFNYEVENGTGTGYVASSHKTWTATYPGSSTYSAGAAATGMTNGVTYTHCFVLIDSKGMRWRLNKDIAASATPSTVDVPDSYANHSLRHLLYMHDINLPYIVDHQAAIAASGNPAGKYISYEFAPSNQDEESVAPAAALTWMRAEVEDPANKAVMKLNLTKQSAQGAAACCWFSDVGAWDVSWLLANSYYDTTDLRYVGYSEFAGAVPVYTQLTQSDISAPGITSTPSLPYVVTALPSDGTTYSVVKASPSVDQYDVNAGNLRLISNLGIDYGTSVARTIRLRKANGLTDTFFNVNVTTGPALWYPATSIFVFDSIADTDPAVLNASVGNNGTLSGPAATISANLWLNGTGAYNASTTGAVNLASVDLLFAVLINTNGQTNVNDLPVQLSSQASTDGLAAFGTYFSSPQTLDLRLATGGGYDARFVIGAKDGVTKVAWFLARQSSGKIHYGANQTESNAAGGDAYPASYATTMNAFLGTTASSMKYGSIMVVAEAGMTISKALGYIQAMQTHHGI